MKKIDLSPNVSVLKSFSGDVKLMEIMVKIMQIEML